MKHKFQGPPNEHCHDKRVSVPPNAEKLSIFYPNLQFDLHMTYYGIFFDKVITFCGSSKPMDGLSAKLHTIRVEGN